MKKNKLFLYLLFLGFFLINSSSFNVNNVESARTIAEDLLSVSADTGAKSAGTVINVDITGGIEWNDVDNCTNQNDTYAVTDILGGSDKTDWLRLSNFGFSIPTGVTIDGILVEIDCYVSSTNVRDLELNLHIGGITSGDNKAETLENWPTSDNDSYRTYGNNSDTWNSGYSYADINNVSFGVQYRMKNARNGPSSYRSYVDHIKITVYYTENNPPKWVNLTESADPLELSLNETISINVIDESGINQVLLEYDNFNHTMTNTVGNTWSYSKWQPSSTGVKEYKIYMEDNNNNWNETTTYDITVITGDFDGPSFSYLIESANILELGESVRIQVNTTDISGINSVYIEISEVKYSMINLVGDTWIYTNWTPTTLGTLSYKIWANDSKGNENEMSDSILVRDLSCPIIEQIIESSDSITLGDEMIIKIVVSDSAGVEQVIITIGEKNNTMEEESLESSLLHSATSSDSTTFVYRWTPTGTGIQYYTIYVKDNNGNWNSFIGSFNVKRDTLVGYLVDMFIDNLAIIISICLVVILTTTFIVAILKKPKLLRAIENRSKKQKDFRKDPLSELKIKKEVGIFKIFHVLKTGQIKEIRANEKTMKRLSSEEVYIIISNLQQKTIWIWKGIKSSKKTFDFSVKKVEIVTDQLKDYKIVHINGNEEGKIVRW